MKNFVNDLTIKIYTLIIIIIMIVIYTFPQAKFDDYYIHIRGYFYNIPIEKTEYTHKNILKNNNKLGNIKYKKINNLIKNEITIVDESLNQIKKVIHTPFEYGSKADSNEGLWNILKNNLEIDPNKNNIKTYLLFSLLIFLFIFLILSIILRKLFAKSILSHSGLLILLSLFLAYCTKNILLSYFKEDYLKNNYISPKIILDKSIKPKKNLVLIYVESLESTFSNKKVFNEDILKPLTSLGGITVPIIPNKGTTNTLTGVFSSLCGYPFYAGYSARDKNIRSKLYRNDKFCLGNVLDFYNYEQHSIHGTRSDYFLNKDLKNIFNKNKMTFHDCNDLKKQKYPIYYPSFDGCFHNEEVLEETERYLHKVNQNKNKKFNISSFLLDTHTPNGFFSKHCLNTEKNDTLKIRGSFKCAIRMLRNKITFWKTIGYLDNTIVVIMGDHPFMPNWKLHKQFPTKRYVYFQILGQNQKKLSKKRQYMNHFDVMPTILDALEILPDKYNRIDLGSSIFREDRYFNERQKHLEKEYYLFSDL